MLEVEMGAALPAPTPLSRGEQSAEMPDNRLTERTAFKYAPSMETPTPIDTDRFATTIRDLIEALEDCFKKGHDFASLILFYAEMDFISSLSRPISQADTNGGVFKAWVDRYMLPNSKLTCSSEDIWAARCGILHTLSVSSKDSRRGVATELFYTYTSGEADKLQAIADSQGRNLVIVSMPSYREAFYKGICQFLEAIKTDPDLHASVTHHFESVAAVAHLPSTAAKK